MAKKKVENTVADPMPTFVLRADNPVHLRALMWLAEELFQSGLDEQNKDVRKMVREFDLWEENHR
jgi:hypothetical protein